MNNRKHDRQEEDPTGLTPAPVPEPPPAWQGPTFVLADRTRDSLGRKLVRLSYPPADYERYLCCVSQIASNLPVKLRQVIRNFRNDPAAPGALLIRNLPQDPELPPRAPNAEPSAAKKTHISEGVVFTLGLPLGEPFAHQEEHGGQLVHEICPVKGKEKEQTGTGAEVNFGFHNDLAYFPNRPDFLVLVCLRSDARHEAATCVAEARDACRLLAPDHPAILRQPLFRVRAPKSFERFPGDVRWSEPRPILTGPADLPDLCVNLNDDSMQALPSPDDRAQRALDALRAAMDAPAVIQFVYLQPGDALLLDNRKVAHGRTSFTPLFDGRDRWLQRGYFRTDLRPNRSTPQAPLRVFSQA